MPEQEQAMKKTQKDAGNIVLKSLADIRSSWALSEPTCHNQGPIIQHFIQSLEAHIYSKTMCGGLTSPSCSEQVPLLPDRGLLCRLG